MSSVQVIARLEALLARVRSRAGEPRPERAAADDAPPPVATNLAAAQAVVPAEAAPPVVSAHPSIADDDVGDWPTRPPPAAFVGAAVEVSGPAIGQTDPAAPAAPVEEVGSEKRDKAYESRERLVAAESVGSDEAGPDAGAAASAPSEAGTPSTPEVEAVIEDAPIEALVAEESAADEPPASSRRTVANQPEEQLAQIAFGGDEPREPLHTPPPESGSLPAATAVDFDGDVTGVRDSAPVAAFRPERAGSARPEPAAGGQTEDTEAEPGALLELQPEHEVDVAAAAAAAESAALGSPRAAHELVPEPTHPNLPETDTVAEVIGEAQRFSPGTFVALLDASLAL